MSNGYTRSDSGASDSGNKAFVAGLFAGAVLGAGFGLLFAPRKGSELRGQVADRAATVGKAVSETIDEVTEAGREAYEQARDVVVTTADGIDRLAGEAAKSVTKGLSVARDMAPGRSRRADLTTQN
jgi:gas vesicle protein